MLRGIGFFQALAAAQDQSRWTELSAGLVVLRCAEVSLNHGGAGASEIAAARSTIAELSTPLLRSRLSTIISSLVPMRRTMASARVTLASELFAYGLELHAAGELGASVDVFEVLIVALADDPSRQLATLQRKAFACRLLKRFDDAELTYDTMEALAGQARNVGMRVEARLGRAKVAIERGNIPRAESLVTDVLAEARKHKLSETIGRALIDRAAIAGIRHDPVAAIVDTNAALDFVTSDSTRDRLLMNMATAFREVGHSAVAQDLFVYLAAEAQDADIRAGAVIGRYHIAIDDGDERAALAAGRWLADQRLSPQVEAEYYEVIAREHAAHERFAAADSDLRRMLTVAETAGMSELIFRAESALADVARGAVPAPYAYRPVVKRRAAQRIARIEGAMLALTRHDVPVTATT